jgi:trans-aconitate 2-methyltransferase
MTEGPTPDNDWNPETYARFRGLRLRPALDLLMQVGPLPLGDIVDLGCGDGAAAGGLRSRYPKHALVGVDASPAMLAKARGYAALVQADAAAWRPAAPPALIFSNAALHWLGDHAALLLRLAGFLAPEGVLAVQMPRQYLAPSHRFLRDIAAAMFPDRFDFAGYEPPVAPAAAYWDMLAPLGQVQAWETDYVQHLDRATGMHPVRAFTEATAMRPFVDKLTPSEIAAYHAAYDQALDAAYPLRADGSCLMPFRRVFFTLKV